MTEPNVEIDRYAGYGGDEESPCNGREPIFYCSGNDIENVIDRMEGFAKDRELTWWHIVDRANHNEVIIGSWEEDHYNRAKAKWQKNHYWGVAK